MGLHQRQRAEGADRLLADVRWPGGAALVFEAARCD
jgi:hypothetical protein